MKNLRIDFFTQPFEGTNFYININVDRAEFGMNLRQDLFIFFKECIDCLLGVMI